MPVVTINSISYVTLLQFSDSEEEAEDSHSASGSEQRANTSVNNFAVVFSSMTVLPLFILCDCGFPIYAFIIRLYRVAFNCLSRRALLLKNEEREQENQRLRISPPGWTFLLGEESCFRLRKLIEPKGTSCKIWRNSCSLFAYWYFRWNPRGSFSHQFFGPILAFFCRDHKYAQSSGC